MWDAIGTGAQLPAWPGGCLSPVLSCARAGAAAGVPSRVLLSELCSLPVHTHWTAGFAPLSQGVQGLVLQLLWEVGVGRSPSHGAHHGQLVFFLLQRTDINLQRSQFAALLHVCVCAALLGRYWLCCTQVPLGLPCPGQAVGHGFHVQELPKPQLLCWIHYQPPPPHQ